MNDSIIFSLNKPLSLPLVKIWGVRRDSLSGKESDHRFKLPPREEGRELPAALLVRGLVENDMTRR